MMRYQKNFKDLHDQFWGDLMCIDGETSIISILISDEVCFQWADKTRLYPNDPFVEIYQSIGVTHSHMDISRDFEVKRGKSTLGLYCGSKNPMLIMGFTIHTIRFKSGIVLKTDDEISMYCYDNYKTTDKEEWAKSLHFWSRCSRSTMKKTFLEVVPPPRSI